MVYAAKLITWNTHGMEQKVDAIEVMDLEEWEFLKSTLIAYRAGQLDAEFCKECKGFVPVKDGQCMNCQPKDLTKAPKKAKPKGTQRKLFE